MTDIIPLPELIQSSSYGNLVPLLGPGDVILGHGGFGNMQHVVGAFFQKETGTHFQFEPYRGSGPAMQDLVAGQIDMMAADPVTALDRLRQQRSLAVAQATLRRRPHGEPWLEAETGVKPRSPKGRAPARGLAPPACRQTRFLTVPSLAKGTIQRAVKSVRRNRRARYLVHLVASFDRKSLDEGE